MGSSESESEEERRVVKSAKQKAVEELSSVCNEIRVSPTKIKEVDIIDKSHPLPPKLTHPSPFITTEQDAHQRLGSHPDPL